MTELGTAPPEEPTDAASPVGTSIETLRALPLFEELSDEQLRWLAAQGSEVTYPAGAMILAEGAPADAFYVLLEGAMRLHHIPPGSADAEVHLDALHLAATPSPPSLDELRRRPRLVDQVPRRGELPRDQDLGVMGSVTAAAPPRVRSIIVHPPV